MPQLKNTLSGEGKTIRNTYSELETCSVAANSCSATNIYTVKDHIAVAAIKQYIIDATNVYRNLVTVSIYRYPTQIPFAAGIRPRSIYDLEMDIDEHGNHLFVESRDKKTRKREVWYRMCQRSGRVSRCTRTFYGTNSETISDNHWLPRRE